MRVGVIGYNYRHEDNFIKDVPNGNDTYLLLLIKEPSIFTINNETVNVKKNSFVLISPGTPYSYRGVTNVYTDDWIYLVADENNKKEFEDLGIISDSIIHLGTIDELSLLVKNIAFEHFSTAQNHEEIEDLYFQIFLLKLSRMIKEHLQYSSSSSDKQTNLLQIRTLIYASPDTVPDIETLALSLNMSKSGFWHLYKKTFGVSLNEDKIKGKMEYAKQLLSSTNLSIREIAIKCGYSDEYGFIKRFKTHYGKTPTEFRSIL